MDAEREPGEGARAAGLVAFEDRFDALAEWLLCRLDAERSDLEVQVARQVLAWRDGQLGLKSEFRDASAWRPADAQPHWHRLLLACVEHSLPDEAAALLEVGASSANSRDEVAAGVKRWLHSLQDAPSTSERSTGAVMLLLPNGEAAPTKSDSASVRRRWWPWPRAADSWPALGAHAGRIPQLATGQVPVVDDGTLDRYTARHWVEVLRGLPRAVITRLKAHDPAARSDALVQALHVHEPVGTADLTSWLLLREWGIRCVVMGPLPDRTLAAPTFDLWTDAKTPDWVAAWDRIQKRSLSGSSDAQVDLRDRWLELTRDAVAVDESRSTWEPPLGGFDAETLRREVRLRRLVGDAMPPDEAIELAFAVDSGLAGEFPVALESCLARVRRAVHCHVMVRGVPEETLDEWKRLFAGRVGLTAYLMDAVHIADEPRLIAHTTESTLDRLLLPWLLPSVSRVIYLDVDLVVMDDLEPLWRQDLQGHALAAKPGSSPGTRWGLQMLYRAVGQLPPPQARAARAWLHRTGPLGFRAFNAGVLVMDLDRLRRDDPVGLWLSLVAHAAMNDQDVLNAWSRGSYLPLDGAWNAAPRQDPTQGAKIIHFVGPVKPWHELYISRKNEYQCIRERIDSRRRELGIE